MVKGKKGTTAKKSNRLIVGGDEHTKGENSYIPVGGFLYHVLVTENYGKPASKSNREIYCLESEFLMVEKRYRKKEQASREDSLGCFRLTLSEREGETILEGEQLMDTPSRDRNVFLRNEDSKKTWGELGEPLH